MDAVPSAIRAVDLAIAVKQKSRELGFDLVGIAPADPSQYRQYFRQWLDDGRGGEMYYLARRFEERTDPAVYMPGVRSVICLAKNYHTPMNREVVEDHGRVARYALGEDYHETIKPRLRALADWLRTTVTGAQTKCGVDTAPIMEKELAARAGIGWMGKNTCIINPEKGSWLLLGEVLTNLDLPADDPAVDRCGTCTRCIDACPTDAISAPYQMDARKCISYLTIEHRGEIGESIAGQMGDWVFGCDVCQDVCPWNRKAPATDDPNYRTRFEGGKLRLSDVLSWCDADYQSSTRNSAMRRVKLPVLHRNARIAERNFKLGSINGG